MAEIRRRMEEILYGRGDEGSRERNKNHERDECKEE